MTQRINRRQFNRALEARRQPGSAFKPFVYLAAFEHDSALGPMTMVKDEPRTFRQGGRRWTPSNYTGRFEGTVTYRRALALSLNVATAAVGEQVGFGRVADLWHRMGMTSRIEPYPSLVLGSFEVTPIELATAYAVLANGGNLSHHHGVGLNRSRFAAEALGEGLTVLARIKQALDPNGILNPGKLGLASRFGDVAWP